MMIKYILTLASASLFLLSGCNHEDFQHTQEATGTLAVHFSRTGMTNGTASDTESQITTLNAYRFENGILKETFNSLQINEEGTCQLQIEQRKGSLYFLANSAKVIAKENLQKDITTLNDFLKLTATSEEMTSENLLMSGKANLNIENNSLSIALKRAVARIDLDSPFQDAVVNSVIVKDVALTGFVNEQDANQSPGEFEKTSLTKDFGDQPFKNGKTNLFYLPEQYTNGHEVEIMMTANGGWHRLKQLFRH